jgi:dCTP deaminase
VHWLKYRVHGRSTLRWGKGSTSEPEVVGPKDIERIREHHTRGRTLGLLTKSGQLVRHVHLGKLTFLANITFDFHPHCRVKFRFGWHIRGTIWQTKDQPGVVAGMPVGGILTGPEITAQVKAGTIEIDPFNPKHINAGSIDLTLGKQVVLYKDQILDAAEKNDTYDVPFPDTGLVLRPGELYLMHTVERIFTDNYVPVMDGKSSIGRLGIWVDVTAGYGDSGFNGQYTLEIVCVRPVRIYSGMRIAQMRFHTKVGDHLSYQESGNYKGTASMGAVPSLSWKQFP